MFDLKPPQSIFVHADGFLKAVMHLNHPPGTQHFDPLCCAALVANSAFASELYLKCLIQIDTGQIIKADHDLRKLFLKLPKKTQQEIETPFNTEMATAPLYDLSKAPKDAVEAASKRAKNLNEALSNGRDAFVRWRYLYEDDAFSKSFDLFSLPQILRGTILIRHPEWAHFKITMTKLGDALPTFQPPKTRAQDA